LFLGIDPTRLLIADLRDSLAKFIVQDTDAYRDAKWDGIRHDIYAATILHPGIIADGVAIRTITQNSRTLSSRLEQEAVNRYDSSSEFREMLSAAGAHAEATEFEACAARDWLSAQMEAWARDFVEAEKI
jgi:hypothetical protein